MLFGGTPYSNLLYGSIVASILNVFFFLPSSIIVEFADSNPFAHLSSENGGLDTITSNFIKPSCSKCNGLAKVSPHSI